MSKRRNVSRNAATADQSAEISMVSHQSLWQGPMPPPEILAGYAELVPDAPQRIFQQWEDEANHRRDYERRALTEAVKQDKRGQWAAIGFAFGALLLTAYALHMNHPWVAGVFGAGTIGSVVGAFLYQRKSPH